MNPSTVANLFRQLANEFDGAPPSTGGSVGGFPAPGTGQAPPATGGGTTPTPSVPAGSTVIPLDWANPQRMKTADFGGSGADDVIVLQFTTGNTDSGNTLCKIDGSENDGNPGDMLAVLSESPGDFDHPLFISGPSKSITVDFAIGSGNTFGYAARLDKGRTYYVNVRNMQGGNKSFYLHRGNLV